MRIEKCSNCGADAKVVRGSYEFPESGLTGIVIQGIEVLRCKKCKNQEPIIPQMNGLMTGLALAVILKPYRLTGEDVRFLRKHLHMTGEEFSQLLHVDKTTLSKWENDDDPVGQHSDRLIRVVALGLGEGLKEHLEELIRYFPHIRDEAKHVGIQMDAETLKYQYA
jgi:putative zinc finger/helix-turn-helix YgiT family protein